MAGKVLRYSLAMLGVAGVALWLSAVALAAAPTPKEQALREELLKLNSAGTEEVQNAKLRELLKNRAKAKELVSEANKMMKEAKDDEKPFNLNGTAILGRAAQILKLNDVAEKFYEHQISLATKLKSGQKILLAYENLIDLYFDTKRYQDAIDKCEQVMDMRGPKEVERAKPFILERIVQATARQGKIDQAMSMTKNLLQATENNWYFLQLRGWVEREAGKTDAAIATFQEVIDKVDADKELKTDKDKIKDRVRYTLSGLYVENKDIDKAAKELQTLIKRNPDTATYKNDLGFIWCDHNMNLDESEKLIKEALELDKKEKEKLKKEGKLDEVKPNAAYLDSLGWVYFQQKKYKEALEPLKQATADEEDGNHLEIFDHLADCYTKLGMKKEAIAAWEKGLKMEDLSKRDAERRRKVSEKLRDARKDAKAKD